MENLNLSKYAKKQFYKENDLISVRIDFGGFYDSIHRSRIEGDIESFFDYSELNLLEDSKVEEIYNNINFYNIYNSYIVGYCNSLADIILNEFGISFDFVNLKLDSPREYNFETDVILCEVDKGKIQSLTNIFLNSSEYKEDFIKHIEDITTSKSGYMPFYSFEDIMNNKNDMLYTQVFNFLINNTELTQDIPTDIEYDEWYLSEYEINELHGKD